MRRAPTLPEALRAIAEQISGCALVLRSGRGWDVTGDLDQSVDLLRRLAQQLTEACELEPLPARPGWDGLGMLRELVELESGRHHARELDDVQLVAHAETRIRELEGWLAHPLMTLGQASMPIGEGLSDEVPTWGEVMGSHLARAKLYRAALTRAQETR